MIYNSEHLLDLDLSSGYLKQLEEDNYLFSLMEISRMSATRLENVGVPPIMKKVKRMIEELGNYLVIREDDVIRLDANMMDCVEIRFSSRKDIKVNLYVNDEHPHIEDIAEVEYDEDEMYFTYLHHNRRRIMHGTMDQMVNELKAVLDVS